MAINVNVQYNGGLLPDIILSTQCYYEYHRGNSFICHEDILSLQPHMIPPKRFDISPPDWGMLRTSTVDAFRFFFKHTRVQIFL